MILKKNEIHNADITAYSSEGTGICRINDTVVFVPGAAVDDNADIRIVKVSKSYAYGRIEKLIKSSPARKEIDCPQFPKCGGCDLRHLSYDEELRFKKQRVTDCLKHIAGLDIVPEEIIGADNTNRYRNKAQFPVGSKNGSTVFGFFRERSHDIIPIEDCLIQNEQCSEVLCAVKEWMDKYNVDPYDEETHLGTVRHVYTRSSRKTGEMLVCIVTFTDMLPHRDKLKDILISRVPSVSGIIQCINKTIGNRILSEEYKTVWGKSFIFDYIGELKFKVSARSFFQVNTDQAFRLYSKAKEFAELTGEENVIDLYCGTGTIGLFMADKAKTLFGMEIVSEAIADAKENAELNGIVNAEFVCGDATLLGSDKLKKDGKTVIFVDPPRKGLTNGLIDEITAVYPERVVYVSCDPATLARDLKHFAENGYDAKRCVAVDMFPRTRHVETVVLLSKLNEAKHHVTVELKTDELDLTPAEAKASYEEIREYVNQKYSLTVSDLNIAQVKRKHGIIERENYNLPKSSDSKQPQCTREKENAINEALRYFKMI